uniref:SAC3/GANP/THP3 conserved domain-containing protein n=1 Tax=Ciona savignyi TaxID=51511 RepID=H2ZEH5_CIOSA
MRTETRASPSVQVAVKAFSAVHSNNYARFFNVVKKATYLQAAILHRYFGQVRKQAIQTMARAYTTTKGTSIPLQDIIRTLQFSSITETNTFCAELMISTKPNNIELYRTESYEPEGSMSVFRSGLVSSKMADRSLGAIIAHGRAPSDQLHQPISSFDADGRYVGKYSALLDSPDVVEQPQRDSQDLSQEVISKLEAAGISNMMVKLVTKQLLLEITGEMVVQVSQEVIRATDLVKASTEVAHEVLQQHVEAEVMTICGEVIREELLSKQRHLE